VTLEPRSRPAKLPGAFRNRESLPADQQVPEAAKEHFPHCRQFKGPAKNLVKAVRDEVRGGAARSGRGFEQQMTVLTMQYQQGHFVVSGSDMEPIKFKTRREARNWCIRHYPGSPIRDSRRVERPKRNTRTAGGG
jgi:hypothetical protein